MNAPIEILCRYRVKADREAEFKPLLERHWALLSGLGLVTDEPARLLRCSDQAGNVAFVERFAWRDPSAVQSAHESAQVMQLWEPMGALCEDMEFWNVQPVED